ncbi:GNAT family N-acetyltransferase, partial [Deinococcus multiflagellatus]
AARYELRQGQQVLGYAEFRPAGEDAVMLPHTVVDEGHEGQGLGSLLARGALDDVRAQGKRVVPMCPFIAAYIRRHPEYTDLVHPQQRGVFGL